MHAEDGPEPRSSHTCVLMNEAGSPGFRTGDMLVFGGLAKTRNSGTGYVVSELWRFAMEESIPQNSHTSAVAGKWELITPSGPGPVPRFDHTAVAYKNR